jgi:hypothetical protein
MGSNPILCSSLELWVGPGRIWKEYAEGLSNSVKQLYQPVTYFNADSKVYEYRISTVMKFLRSIAGSIVL